MALSDDVNRGPAWSPGLRDAARETTGYWWLWLGAGVAWIVASLIILQFDTASITTVAAICRFTPLPSLSTGRASTTKAPDALRSCGQSRR